MPGALVVLVAAALLTGWGCVRCTSGANEPHSSSLAIDGDFFVAVINGVRAGGDYYTVMGRELPAFGYPTRPVFTWRLPTLTWLQARLPSLDASVWILTVFGLVSAYLWIKTIRPTGLGRWLASMPFLLATLPAWVWLNPKAATIHDMWAGELIALSLACRAGGLRRSSVVVGAAATAFRELAVPYVLVMAAASWLERRPREFRAWLTVAAGFLVAFAWHALRVREHLPPGSYANFWLVFSGWCFALSTARTNVFLMGAPPFVVALAVPAMLAALWTWRSEAGRRVAATVTVYLLCFVVVGRPFNWIWGLNIAPLLPLGMVAWLGRAQAAPRAEADVSAPPRATSAP